MKKFIQNTLFFVLGLLTIFIFNLGTNYLIISTSKVNLKKSKILIIGDSHPKRGINPSYFNNALNICQTAEPYIITFWKLKSILNTVNPEILLIGFAPHNFSDFNDLKFSNKTWSLEMFKRTYLIQDFKSLNGISINFNEYYTFLFKKLCLFPQLNHVYYIGHYENTLKTNISNLDKTIERHFFFDNKPATISYVSVNYLDSIIELCTVNNITPILVNTPVHKSYKKRIPKNIQSFYDLEKDKWRNKGVFVIDKINEEYPKTFFYNSDHLNDRGSSEFSKKLKRLINTK